MLKQEIGWFDHPNNGVGSLSARLASDAAAVQGVSHHYTIYFALFMKQSSSPTVSSSRFNNTFRDGWVIFHYIARIFGASESTITVTDSQKRETFTPVLQSYLG